MSGESVKKIDPSYQFATLAIKGKIDPTSYHIYQLNSAENSQNDIKQTFIFQLETKTTSTLSWTNVSSVVDSSEDTALS